MHGQVVQIPIALRPRLSSQNSIRFGENGYRSSHFSNRRRRATRRCLVDSLVYRRTLLLRCNARKLAFSIFCLSKIDSARKDDYEQQLVRVGRVANVLKKRLDPKDKQAFIDHCKELQRSQISRLVFS